jgi:hypothetical protein
LHGIVTVHLPHPQKSISYEQDQLGVGKWDKDASAIICLISDVHSDHNERE